MIDLTLITICDVFLINLINLFFHFIIIVFSIIKQLPNNEEKWDMMAQI